MLKPKLLSIALMLLAAGAPMASAAPTPLPSPFDRLLRALEPGFREALDKILALPRFGAGFAADGTQSLRPELDIQDARTHTFKFKHFYHGLEVVGSQVFFHTDARFLWRHPERVRDLLARFDLATRPTVDARAASALAVSYSKPGSSAQLRPALKILPSPDRSSARLIYAVQVAESGDLNEAGDDVVEVWIDAHTGAHLATLPSRLSAAGPAATAAPVEVRLTSARAQGVRVEQRHDDDGALVSCRLTDLRDGTISEVDAAACRAAAKSSCQSVSEAGRPLTMVPSVCAAPDSTDGESADRALLNARATLDYFAGVHQRVGTDGKGSALVTVIHAGTRYDNAFWSLKGQYLAYGDGDGKLTGDYTRALDIAGHELTHAVTQSTAHLISLGETGALNEAFSDYFGKVIENRGSWVLGESVLLNPEPGRGIRDLAAPERLQGVYIDSAGEAQSRPYPRNTSQEAPLVGPCTDRNDFCGVHFNATIPGHAEFEIDQALGRDKAQRLLYLALTQFLGERASFADAAEAVLAACAQSLEPADCARVRAVYADAGMLKAAP